MTHLLLVDDDPGFTEAISAGIWAAGHSVRTLGEGGRAIRLLSGREEGLAPDVLVIDLYMPHQDGIELIEVLRDMGVRTPIIAVSGGGPLKVPKLPEMARFLGANAIMEKPFSAAELLALAESLLAQERVG